MRASDRKSEKTEQAPVVSFDTERLILVDSDDREIGSGTKSECHDGDGVLHRAFSAFVFNSAGELLLQKRSADKRLWPDYWSNSCCSHPRVGETMSEAVTRRLAQELGITAKLEYVYKFEYQAKFSAAGSENELCWVYAGHTLDAVSANSNEVSDWHYVAPDDLDQELIANPGVFTPWFKMEWDALRTDYAAVFSAAMERSKI